MRHLFVAAPLVLFSACNPPGDSQGSAHAESDETPTLDDEAVRAPATESDRAQSDRAQAEDAQSDRAPAEGAAPIEAPEAAAGAAGSNEPAASCGPSINRALMAREVLEREPVGTAGPFSADGEPIYLFAEFDNRAGPDSEVTLRWRHDASEHVFEQQMDVGVSPSWRTWARHRIAPSRTGAWAVDIVGPDDCVTRTVAFTAE